MKKVNRAKLRAEKLLPICSKAHTSVHEYGTNDNRVFCYGVNDDWDCGLRDECKKCRAHVNFAEPLKGGRKR